MEEELYFIDNEFNYKKLICQLHSLHSQPCYKNIFAVAQIVRRICINKIERNNSKGNDYDATLSTRSINLDDVSHARCKALARRDTFSFWRPTASD